MQKLFSDNYMYFLKNRWMKSNLHKKYLESSFSILNIIWILVKIMLSMETINRLLR